MDIGGYLIWQCFPERKVFIDGRFEVYGPEFLMNFNSELESIDRWNDYMKKYDVNYVLLTLSSPEGQSLIWKLIRSREWELIYIDSIATVFIKNAPKNSAWIEKYRINYFENNKGQIIINHKGLNITIG